jgi:hypothetical protein
MRLYNQKISGGNIPRETEDVDDQMERMQRLKWSKKLNYPPNWASLVVLKLFVTFILVFMLFICAAQGIIGWHKETLIR